MLLYCDPLHSPRSVYRIEMQLPIHAIQSSRIKVLTYKYFLCIWCDLMSVCTCSAASFVFAKIKTPVLSFSRLWQMWKFDPACMSSVTLASKGRHSAMLFLIPSTPENECRVNAFKIHIIRYITMSCQTYYEQARQRVYLRLGCFCLDKGCSCKVP